MSHIVKGQLKHTDVDSTYQGLAPIAIPTNSVSLSSGSSPSQLSSAGGAGTYTVTATNAGSTSITLDDFVVTLPAGATFTPG